MRHLTHNPISITHQDDEYVISQQVGETADDVITIRVTEDQAAQISKFLAPPAAPRQSIPDGVLDEGFSDFWSLYPRKDAKARALDIWRRQQLANKKQVVIDHLVAIKATDQWTKDGGRFVPHAATYLSQKRYLDDVEVEDVSLFL